MQSSGDNYLQVSGSPGAGGTQQWYNLATNYNFATLGELPYAIQPNDTLAWLQWQSATASGGILLQLESGCTAALPEDKEGYPLAADTVTGEWHNRVVDLTPLQGCILDTISVGLNTGSTGSGVSADFAEVVLYSPNGAGLVTLFNGNGIAYTGALSGNNMPSPLIHYSTRALAGSLPGVTHFFTTDQVGTAQLEFAAGGWPVWQGEFTPYGGAVSASGPTANNYQFTGQERDRETADIVGTGLDFMNARYYSSTLGRFTTPDPYLGSMDLTNPQSFNRYTYALNNPLKYVDPTGLDYCMWDDGTQDDTPQNGGATNQECYEQGGTIVIQVQAQQPGGSGSSDTDNDPDSSPWGLSGLLSNAANAASTIGAQAVNWINAPRDPGCLAGFAAGGATVGAVGGGVVGAVVGGGGGTLVAPGFGTVGGGIAGAAEGASLGAQAGFIGGTAAGFVMCAQGSGPSRSGSPLGSRGNKQANAAKAQAQRITGKTMTPDQEELFHEETKYVDYSQKNVYDQLVQIAVGILQ